MKNKAIITLLVLAWTSYSVVAQQVSYQLIEDNPDALSENFINLELLGIDYGANSTDGNVYVGGNIFWSLSDKIKAEGLMRVTAFNIKGKGLGLQTEAGIFLPLVSKTKKDNVPVILKETAFAGKNEFNQTYDEVKFFNVDGTVKSQIGPRGGIYFKKTGYEAKSAPTSMTLTGVYFGVEKLTQAFVKTKVGDTFKYGSGQTRVYFDVLLLPARSIDDPAITDPERDSSFGWRVGMQWNKKPHKTKEGFEKRLVYNGELGKRPFTGFYINVSIGLMLFSK